MHLKTKVQAFWLYYFIARIFFLLFDVFVYSKLTTLGDTGRYLDSGVIKGNVFFNSTAFMDMVGHILSRISMGNPILSNFPITIASFLCVKWVVQELRLREHINSALLFILISLPNFCIWTSVLSKEFFGLVFSSILGILFVNFINGNYRLHIRDYVAVYLCLLFKPQYFPFIFQGLLYIYLSRRLIKKANSRVILALLIIAANILFVYYISDIVNELSYQMYAHFDFAGTSTRSNIFTKEGDFFRYAPYGMFQSFMGPTFGEMIRNPLQLVAGIESLVIIVLFIWLTYRCIFRVLLFGRISPIPIFSVLITTIGILFVHYPFGIFNAGSAIRYRTNFLFLFIILFSYLYIYYKPVYSDEEGAVLR